MRAGISPRRLVTYSQLGRATCTASERTVKDLLFPRAAAGDEPLGLILEVLHFPATLRVLSLHWSARAPQQREQASADYTV